MFIVRSDMTNASQFHRKRTARFLKGDTCPPVRILRRSDQRSASICAETRGFDFYCGLKLNAPRITKARISTPA